MTPRLPSNPATRRSASVWALGGIACLAAGCTFLVEFADRETSDDSDGGIPQSEAGTIVPGVDGGGVQDGTVIGDDGSATPDASTDAAPPVDTGPGPPTCTGKVDGTPFAQDVYCCGGQPVPLSSNTNCGACGIACRTDLGHQCQIVFGHARCVGCANDGGGSHGSCWSSCCSGNACAPENFLGCGFGICDDGICQAKSPGSNCGGNPAVGTYCQY